MSRVRLNVVGALCLSVLMLGAAVVGPSNAPVADAAMRGDVDTVRDLLRRGEDVNAAQGDGMTALHWAAERGNAELAEMLIYAGANVSAETRIGRYTPLHLASRRGSAPVVQKLLEGGADATARTTTTGVTPLHLAAAAGGTDAVKLLLAAGADPNARETEAGQTPLIFAASRDRAPAIAALIEGGADPNLESTPLDLQAESRREGQARAKQNAVLEAIAGENANAEAVTSGQLATAVLAGREVYLRGGDENGEVAEEDDPDRDPDEPRPDRGRPSITAMGGLTPLHYAARQGYLDAARALLDGGADIDAPSGGDHTTPLLIATINGEFDLALMLVQRGADPNIAADINGVTPLWATVNSRWQPRTRFPQPQEAEAQKATYLDVMQALLESGANPDHRITMHPWYLVYSGCGNRNCGLADTEGSTAFWRAAYATDVDAMRLLVQYGADPNIPTVAPAERPRRPSREDMLRERSRDRITVDSLFAELGDSARIEAMTILRDGLPEHMQKDFPDFILTSDYTARVRTDLIAALDAADEYRKIHPDPSGLPPVEPGGPGVYAIHAAAGVGYGEGFAGNAHRHAPDAWLASVRFLVEDVGMDVNARDSNGYTALHHAAARGDNELILYLVEKGADVTVVSRKGQSVVDMANSPVSRISPIPETIALLEALGARNNHNCVSC